MLITQNRVTNTATNNVAYTHSKTTNTFIVKLTLHASASSGK